MENFVLKMAAEFPSRRDQLIFLINNYDMMLSVLMVSVCQLSVPPASGCTDCFCLLCPGEGSR